MGEAKSSVFAAEGTAAHELAAHCLKAGFDAEKYLGHVIDITAKDVTARFLRPASPLGDTNTRFEVDEEMVDGVQMFVDFVRGKMDEIGKGVEVEVETRLDISHVHPDIFGTGDVIIYDPRRHWLHVPDFKYGKGVVVEVDENPQLFTYGSGVAQRYHNRQIKGMTLYIVQPRAYHPDGHIRSWDADLVTLMEFEDTLAKAATATEAEDAPRIPGHWCNFCPALPVCPEARDKATTAALAEFMDEDTGELAPPEAMDGRQLADVLVRADFILTWVKSVQAYAHEQACNGNMPHGYKLVQKRAMRKWIDEDEARDELLCVFGEKSVFTEPKLKSPAQLEKAVGKRIFEQAAESLVHKVSSGTNLVPITDPRPAAKNAGMEDFA